MKTLGYIVTDRKLKDIDGFVEQVNDISLADSTKPILVVGWKNAKNCDGYTSILEKQLGENIYWTFSKSESRSDFEEDLQTFYSIIGFTLGSTFVLLPNISFDLSGLLCILCILLGIYLFKIFNHS